MEDRKINSKEKQKILDLTFLTADATLAIPLMNWKEYPLDQWFRELLIGVRTQALFQPPKKCICGGTWLKIKTTKLGQIYKCSICASEIPVASHIVQWTNEESIMLLI